MVYVLFDIDETMLSVPKGINAKTSSVMFKKVFALDAHEGMIDNSGKTEMGIIKEVVEQMGGGQEFSSAKISEEAYKVWAQETARELKKHPAQVLPGVRELLAALSNNPAIELGLLTGNSYWRAEAKLQSGNLDNFFRERETGHLWGVFGNLAPARDQLFGLAKEEAKPEDRFVLIDDSLVGGQMAQKYNIPIIMAATGKATQEELQQFTPYVFSDFGGDRWKEVVSLIEAM